MRKIDTSPLQLDSDLLRSFLAVARAGSLSAATGRLLRTQSAISLKIQRLERVIGQPLFTRHGRGVSLTASGETLLPVARHIVETLDQAAIAMREVQHAGEIRAGIPEEYGDTLLPAILSHFSKDQPGARILLRCGSSADFPAALGTGELDIALHAPETVTKRDVVVGRETAVWASSAYHDIETRRPLPVVLFDRACWWRERCLDLLNNAEVDYDIVCTSESVAGVRAAISSGFAIGVLPQSSLTEGVRRLSDRSLPHLGTTRLVLTRSPEAPARLADSLAAIIKKTIRAL